MVKPVPTFFCPVTTTYHHIALSSSQAQFYHPCVMCYSLNNLLSLYNMLEYQSAFLQLQFSSMKIKMFGSAQENVQFDVVPQYSILQQRRTNVWTISIDRFFRIIPPHRSLQSGFDLGSRNKPMSSSSSTSFLPSLPFHLRYVDMLLYF